MKGERVLEAEPIFCARLLSQSAQHSAAIATAPSDTPTPAPIAASLDLGQTAVAGADELVLLLLWDVVVVAAVVPVDVALE